MPSFLLRSLFSFVILGSTVCVVAHATTERDCDPPLVALGPGPDLSQVDIALSRTVRRFLDRRKFPQATLIEALRTAPTAAIKLGRSNSFVARLPLVHAGFDGWIVEFLWIAADHRVIAISIRGDRRLHESEIASKPRRLESLPVTKVRLSATARTIARLAGLGISPEDIEHAILHPLSYSLRGNVAGERWLVGETADGYFLMIIYEIHPDSREIHFAGVAHEESLRRFLNTSPPVFEAGKSQIHVASGPFAGVEISYARGREIGIEQLYDLEREDVEEGFLLSRGGVPGKYGDKQKWFAVQLRPTCIIKIVYDIVGEDRITVRMASRSDRALEEYEQALAEASPEP